MKGDDNMKHYHCPVNGWDCPYFVNKTNIDGKEESCICGMTFDGFNPYFECDDFYSAFGDCESEKDYTDYGEED